MLGLRYSSELPAMSKSLLRDQNNVARLACLHVQTRLRARPVRQRCRPTLTSRRPRCSRGSIADFPCLSSPVIAVSQRLD
jgi:hypothetical protein